MRRIIIIIIMTLCSVLLAAGRSARAFVVVRPASHVRVVAGLGRLSQQPRRGSCYSLYSTAAEASTTSSSSTTTSSGVTFPLADFSTVQEAPPRLRFAPSPTGSLHVGGARTALYNWLMAQKGKLEYNHNNNNNHNFKSAFVVRVEDTDLARSTKESEKSVLDDLQWLGLHWDEGPDFGNNDHDTTSDTTTTATTTTTTTATTAPYGPYRQSERSELYTQLAQSLLDQGKAYRCFCSQEELQAMKEQQEAAGIPPRYDGTWRDADPAKVQEQLDAGVPHVVRFQVPPKARVVIDDVVRGLVAWDADATVGDFILMRSNGVPVYNFCVAVDDATMGITTVVRAEEHLTNTLRQGLILDALGAPRPRYAHCSLILGEDKQKLSKRHGATSCNQFRLDGFLPDAMINYLALLGWNDGTDNEIFTRDELIDAFDVNRVVKSPSVFDMDKLKWVNSQHMKTMHTEDLLDLVKEQMQLEGLLKEGVSLENDQVAHVTYAATALAKQMMETTKDAALNAKVVLGYALPETFDELQDADAVAMIKLGNFYPIISRIVSQVDAGEFPMPDLSHLLDAFKDERGKAIEEDNHPGPGSYPDAYKAHMKALVKEFDVHGKNLFHPIRLALTGEMSGQDVTKQLSLLTMASMDDSVIDAKGIGVVGFADRMTRLKGFLDSIPEQYRSPRTAEEEMKQKEKDQQAESSTLPSSINLPAPSDPLDTYEGPPITALDIRVGRITKVWEHEEADKLFCEEIDVGEDEPRQVASGLRPYMTADDMDGRLVLVLCNLKERKMVGFPSHGMVLCASNADHSEVRFVSPPVDAKVGERVTVPDFDFEQEEPFAENKVGKKKVFEKIAPHLVTSKFGVPEFLGRPLMTSAGVCTSPIPDGTVS